ncbi:unnamed protein product [Parajaminaea phylloscopi]
MPGAGFAVPSWRRGQTKNTEAPAQIPSKQVAAERSDRAAVNAAAPSQRLKVRQGRSGNGRNGVSQPPVKSSLEVAWSYSRSQAHHIHHAAPSSPSFTERHWQGPQQSEGHDQEDSYDEGYSQDSDDDELQVDNDETACFMEDARELCGDGRMSTAYHNARSGPLHRSYQQAALRKVLDDAGDDSSRARSRSPKRLTASGAAAGKEASRGRAHGRRELYEWNIPSPYRIDAEAESSSTTRERRGSHHERYSLRSSSRDYSDDYSRASGRSRSQSRSRGDSRPPRSRPQVRRHSSSNGEDAQVASGRLGPGPRAAAPRSGPMVDERTRLLEHGHARSRSSPVNKLFANYGSRGTGGQSREDGLAVGDADASTKLSGAPTATTLSASESSWLTAIAAGILDRLSCLGPRRRAGGQAPIE